MINGISRLGPRALTFFAEWTDRIAAGETPPAPPRPQGIERTVVITEWDWADPKAYLHDEVSTDRRKPTVNANGPIYGALELSADYVPVLDPVRHTTSRVPLTVRDPNTPATSTAVPQPSPYWGSEAIWTSRNNVHNPMLDERGRVWLTSAVRPPDNPDFCREGSPHPSAKLFPIARASRHLAMYDPSTKKLTHISTCFGTHHLMFAEDANNTLWTSGGGQVVGWLEHEDVRRDRRRSEVAGMDRARHGHEWQRQAGRVCRARPAGRSRQGQAIRQRLLCRRARARRIDLGLGAGISRRGRSIEPGREPAGDRAGGGLRTAARHADERPSRLLAARHGHRPQRRRLGGPRQRSPRELRSPQVQGAAQRSGRHRASTVPKAGRSTPSRSRRSPASPTRAAPKRATTRGWISSTRSGSARTCRSTPAMRPRACWF